MMQIKFQCYRPFGAREEDFLRFLPYMVMVSEEKMLKMLTTYIHTYTQTTEAYLS